MAILENSFSQECIYLRISHIFGRASASVNTLVGGQNVSRVHATIGWQADFWTIQDSSTNGTYVNGEKLDRAHKRRLHKGDKIHFGEISEDYWVFKDDAAPRSMLVPIGDANNPIELSEITVLPSHDSPEITLYSLPDQLWYSENSEKTEQLHTGDTIRTSMGDWYFVDNYPLDETSFYVDGDDKSAVKSKAHFAVSQNEEHVSLTVTIGQYELSLGRKAGHYLLLMLARKRLNDLNNQVIQSEAGWLDKGIICSELKIEEQYMNIQIFRYRKQLEQTAPQHLFLPQTIERRFGEIRVNFDEIVIEGGFEF